MKHRFQYHIPKWWNQVLSSHAQVRPCFRDHRVDETADGNVLPPSFVSSLRTLRESCVEGGGGCRWRSGAAGVLGALQGSWRGLALPDRPWGFRRTQRGGGRRGGGIAGGRLLKSGALSASVAGAHHGSAPDSEQTSPALYKDYAAVVGLAETAAGLLGAAHLLDLYASEEDRRAKVNLSPSPAASLSGALAQNMLPLHVRPSARQISTINTAAELIVCGALRPDCTLQSRAIFPSRKPREIGRCIAAGMRQRRAGSGTDYCETRKQRIYDSLPARPICRLGQCCLRSPATLHAALFRYRITQSAADIIAGALQCGCRPDRAKEKAAGEWKARSRALLESLAEAREKSEAEGQVAQALRDQSRTICEFTDSSPSPEFLPPTSVTVRHFFAFYRTATPKNHFMRQQD